MYVTGSATSVADLMTKIKDFCTNATAGYPAYTLLSFGTEGTGHRLHISKSGAANYFFNFRSVVNESVLGTPGLSGIYMNAGLDFYNSGSTWYNQLYSFTYDNSSKYVISGINNITGEIVSYHFFYFKQTNNYDVVYIVVESPSGSYQRLMFGIMDSASIHNEWSGNAPNGLFYNGSVSHNNVNYSLATSFFGSSDVGWQSGSPSGAVFATFNTEGIYYTGWASGDFSIPQNQMSEPTPQVFDMSMKMQSIFLCSPSTFSSMPPLHPVTICATANTTSTMNNSTPWYPIGTLPNVYMVNMFNISSGATITIGSDTYKVFPFRKKSDTWSGTSPNNGTYRFGYAIKTS